MMRYGYDYDYRLDDLESDEIDMSSMRLLQRTKLPDHTQIEPQLKAIFEIKDSINMLHKNRRFGTDIRREHTKFVKELDENYKKLPKILQKITVSQLGILYPEAADATPFLKSIISKLKQMPSEIIKIILQNVDPDHLNPFIFDKELRVYAIEIFLRYVVICDDPSLSKSKRYYKDNKCLSADFTCFSSVDLLTKVSDLYKVKPKLIYFEKLPNFDDQTVSLINSNNVLIYSEDDVECDFMELIQNPVDIQTMCLYFSDLKFCKSKVRQLAEIQILAEDEDIEGLELSFESVMLDDTNIVPDFQMNYEAVLLFLSAIISLKNLYVWCAFDDVFCVSLPSNLQKLELSINNIDYNQLTNLVNLRHLDLKNNRFPFELFSKESILPYLECFRFESLSFSDEDDEPEFDDEKSSFSYLDNSVKMSNSMRKLIILDSFTKMMSSFHIPTRLKRLQLVCRIDKDWVEPSGIEYLDIYHAVDPNTLDKCNIQDYMSTFL